MLTSYSWPGNIRELQNVMERYGVLSEVLNQEILNQEELYEILGTSLISQQAIQLKPDRTGRGTERYQQWVGKYEVAIVIWKNLTIIRRWRRKHWALEGPRHSGGGNAKRR